MMQNFSKIGFSVVIKLLLLVLVAKIIGVVLYFILPDKGVDIIQKKRYLPEYQRVDFKGLLQEDAKRKNSAKKDDIKSNGSGISITNMILKGFYGNSKKGFAIVALKSAPKKTSIVAIGEKFNGYTLKEIFPTKVYFQKGSKEYVLELEKLKLGKKNYIKKVKKERTSTIVSEEPHGVSREDIASYAKNPKQIWKDISIVPLKKHNKIDGFKVTKIKKGSKMAELGLQRGDIIIKANNIRLKSYKDALDLYSKIDTIDTMQIVVLRNNEEVELVYEIN